MNPQLDNTVGLNSSQPIDNGPANDSAQIFANQNHYQVGKNLPTGSMQQSTQLAQSSSQYHAVGTQTPASTGVADDTNADALDEQWVNKAKAIVEQTKTDPYTESIELNKAKADYLRIRYNKQVKVNEDRQK